MPLPSGDVSNATEVRSPAEPELKAYSLISLTKLGNVTLCRCWYLNAATEI